MKPSSTILRVACALAASCLIPLIAGAADSSSGDAEAHVARLQAMNQFVTSQAASGVARFAIERVAR